MIQDIYPHIYHNQYLPVPPDPDSFVLVYEGSRICYRTETADHTAKTLNTETRVTAANTANTATTANTIRFPQFRELEGKIEHLYENYIYLFSIDTERFYLIPGLDPLQLPDYTPCELRSLRLVEPLHYAFAGATGHQLFQWYQNRRFCGQCGKPMLHSKAERMMYCPSCGRHEYPQLMPAVIVGITNGDQLLMSKYSGRAFKNYALIAGFAEIGETIEETVHREVMEEVGLKVKNLRYYKSQPWSFSGTLLFGFYCDVDGSCEIHLDENELAMAEWFDRDKIVGQGNNSSLTNEMMLTFAAGKEPK